MPSSHGARGEEKQTVIGGMSALFTTRLWLRDVLRSLVQLLKLFSFLFVQGALHLFGGVENYVLKAMMRPFQDVTLRFLFSIGIFVSQMS